MWCLYPTANLLRWYHHHRHHGPCCYCVAPYNSVVVAAVVAALAVVVADCDYWNSCFASPRAVAAAEEVAFAFHETAVDSWNYSYAWVAQEEVVVVVLLLVVVVAAAAVACDAVAFRTVVVAAVVDGVNALAAGGVAGTDFHRASPQTKPVYCLLRVTAAFRSQEASPSARFSGDRTGAHSLAEVGDAVAFVRVVRGVPNSGDAPVAVVLRLDSHSEAHPDHQMEPSF